MAKTRVERDGEYDHERHGIRIYVLRCFQNRHTAKQGSLFPLYNRRLSPILFDLDQSSFHYRLKINVHPGFKQSLAWKKGCAEGFSFHQGPICLNLYQWFAATIRNLLSILWFHGRYTRGDVNFETFPSCKWISDDWVEDTFDERRELIFGRRKFALLIEFLPGADCFIDWGPLDFDF